MKKTIFLVTLWISAFNANSQLPKLDTLLPAPCGSEYHLNHFPTGEPDAIGFQVSTFPCLPDSIFLEHDSEPIPDLIEVWVQDSTLVWTLLDYSDWHSQLYLKMIVLPPDAVDLIIICSSNLYDNSSWSLVLTCYSTCCQMYLSLTGPAMACPNESVTIWPDSISGAPPFQYRWSDESTFSSLLTSAPETRIFSVTATDSFGCSVRDSFILVVPMSPVLFADTLVCPGSLIQLPKNPIVFWQQQDTITVFENTTVAALVIDTLDCTHIVPFRIKVQKQDYASADTTVCHKRWVELHAPKQQDYKWMNFDGNDLGSSDIFRAFVNTDTSFVLQSIDSLGCHWFDTIGIHTVYCLDAKIFTPNVIMPDDPSNATNGYWKVFLNPEAFQDVHSVKLRIWDRWGAMAFESQSFEIYWDGKYANGTPASPGVYFWQAWIQTIEGTSVIGGDITVIR